MSRHYSPDDREFALQRLVANHGDIARTAKEIGVSTRTLYEWRKSAKMLPSQLQNLRNLQQIAQSETHDRTASPSLHAMGSGGEVNTAEADSKSLSVYGEGFREGLPPDDLQAFRDLKAQMLDLVHYLATDKIKEAIDDAPLNQRIAALVQLTDRIIKLAAQLPAEEIEIELSDDVEEEDEEEDY